MFASEEWRAVEGFDGYEVSNLGRVRSLYFDPPRIVAQWPDKDGYPCVTLGRSKRRYRRVHRLVALSFHGRMRNALHCEAAHLDGNRQNCRADNIKWAGRVENCSHKRRHGTHQRGEAHPRARLTEDDVRAIRASRLSAAMVAARYGVSRYTVADIRERKRWRHVN